jgi:hypothetical protein
MPVPPPLPRTILAELGKVTVIWAHIEQELILHASAMAAYHTDGKAVEYLRMDFKRLREKWYSLCKQNFPKDIVDKVVHPLNTKLCKLVPERGYYVHGLWKQIGRGKFELFYFEQKTGLASYRGNLSLRQVQGFVGVSYRASQELNHFATGKHACFKDKSGTIAKVPAALIPPNEG